MNIEFNKDKPLFTAFHLVREGTVFTYQGNYYLRMQAVMDIEFDKNICINAVRLDDGAAKHFDNHEQVMIVPAKLVIN